MSGVTNPAAGTYGNTTFSLATSKDVTAVVAPTAITIIATVSSVSFSGATQSAGTVTTWTVGFRSSVAGALATGDTITVAFNVNFVTPATPVIVLVTTLADELRCGRQFVRERSDHHAVQLGWRLCSHGEHGGIAHYRGNHEPSRRRVRGGWVHRRNE